MPGPRPVKTSRKRGCFHHFAHAHVNAVIPGSFWCVRPGTAAKTVLTGAHLLEAFYSIELEGVNWAFTFSRWTEGDVSVLDAVAFAQVASKLPMAKGSKVKIV